MSYAFGLFLLLRRNCQISTDYARAAKALNPEHVTVMNGCCAVLAMLSTVLCDPGDGYLIPTPYYGGINLKTWLYGGIQPVHMPLFSEVTDEEGHPFQLTVEKLEDALQRAKKQGFRVRASILINPHNPLGDVYPAQLLKECPAFVHRTPQIKRDLLRRGYLLYLDIWNVIAAVKYRFTRSKTDTFYVGYFSKDFGMRGIRVGVLYTRNHEIQKVVNQLAVFHTCPGPVQHVLSQFLRDRESNLKKQRNILVDGLADVGIPVLRSSGGLLCVSRLQRSIQRLEQMLHSYIAEPVTNNTSSTADALCNPEKDSSGKPSNTPGKDVSQLKNILVY